MNERATASDDVDELIARLAAEGEVAESGVFSIDPELAVERLREFQLSDPVRFVLCWVRAAVLLDAPRVDIQVEASDVRLSFDGTVLTTDELDVLWSAVMGVRKKARTRALRELALGTSGAFSWQAKAVTIQSGPTLVHVDRNFGMRREQVEPGPVANILHAKRPIGWDLLRRRRLDRRGQLPEELLLVRACVDPRIPIYLEGLRINPPPPDPSKPWIQVEIEDEGRMIRYRIGPGMSSKLRVLLAGVEVTIVDLELPPGVPRGLFEATVDDSLLPLDLSQEKAIKGQRWRALLDSVVWARWQAWFALAARERWPRDETGSLHGAGQRALLADILAATERGWMEVPGAMGWAERVELPLAVSDPFGGFRPLLGPAAAADEPTTICEPWPRSEPEPLRFAELLEHADGHGWVFCARERHPELPFVPEVPVIRHGASTKTLHGNDLIELSGPSSIGRYLREVTAVRELSGSRPLPASWIELRHGHRGMRLRVAWRRGARTPESGALIVGREGSVLAEFRLPSSWGPLWVEVDGPFTTTLDASASLPRDELLATAILALLEIYPDLLANFDGHALTDYEREVIHRYLDRAYGRWSAARLHELEAIPRVLRSEAIAAWSGGWGVPRRWEHPPRRERGICDHPLMDLAWLERGGGHVSLRELQRELASRSPIAWLGRGAPEVPNHPFPAEVWRLDPRERRIIEQVFARPLEPFDLHEWARNELPGQAQLPSELPGARSSTTIEGTHGVRGILALPEHDPPPQWQRPRRRSARLRVLSRGHELGWLDVELPIGPFYGVIELPDVGFVAHIDGVLKDQRYRQASKLVECAAHELATRQLQAWSIGKSARHDRARVRDWTFDLERGRWPRFAASWREWQSELGRRHPLFIELAPSKRPTT